jgi:hypothetical protein
MNSVAENTPPLPKRAPLAKQRRNNPADLSAEFTELHRLLAAQPTPSKEDLSVSTNADSPEALSASLAAQIRSAKVEQLVNLPEQTLADLAFALKAELERVIVAEEQKLRIFGVTARTPSVIENIVGTRTGPDNPMRVPGKNGCLQVWSIALAMQRARSPYLGFASAINATLQDLSGLATQARLLPHQAGEIVVCRADKPVGVSSYAATGPLEPIMVRLDPLTWSDVFLGTMNLASLTAFEVATLEVARLLHGAKTEFEASDKKDLTLQKQYEALQQRYHLIFSLRGMLVVEGILRLVVPNAFHT